MLYYNEERKVNKMMKKIENTLYGISALGLIWFVASWVDVVAHNLTTYQYQWWNCFEIFVKAFS